MLKILESINHGLDHLSEWTSKIIIWFVFLMTIITVFIVLLRYSFSGQSHLFGIPLPSLIALQESQVYLHAFIFLLMGAYTLKHNGHVRVDIFYQKLPIKMRIWINLLGSLIFLLPMATIIFYFGLFTALKSWSILEQSPEPGGLAFVYIFKSAMPLAGLLLLLQAVSELIRNILVIFYQHIPIEEEISPEL